MAVALSIHTDDDIMTEAAAVRASSLLHPPKILLPDAIIQATANVTGYLLVTRNKKDFRGANLRYPYELQEGRVFNVALPPTAS
jgi:predicted nucleic acid-binding protein